MSTQAQYLVLEAHTALQDLTGVRWPASELVTYINDGQRDIVSKRPDLHTSTTAMATAAGVRQSVPAGTMVLMDVLCNTNGNKRVVTKVDSLVLGATQRNWQSLPGATEFVHFCYDQRDPLSFDLYPPSASAGGSVDLLLVMYPTDISAPTAPGRLYTTVSGALDVPDSLVNSLRHYVLFRAYSKDAEFGGNAQMAAAHYTAYKEALGEQLQSAAAVAPKD